LSFKNSIQKNKLSFPANLWYNEQNTAAMKIAERKEVDYEY